MSRREIAVNTLLGTFLLLVFVAYLTAIGLIFLFGFIGLDWGARQIFPRMTLPVGFSFLGVWALLAAWSAVGHARKGRWRNAFLLLVSVPLTGFAWFTHVPSSFGSYGHVGLHVFPAFMVIGIAGDANLGRLKFLLATVVAAASLLVNGGLLGNGTLSRTVENCALVVVALWLIAEVWAQYKTASPHQSLTLPPARA